MTLEAQIEICQNAIIILTKEYNIDKSLELYVIILEYEDKLAKLQKEYAKQLRHETN